MEVLEMKSLVVYGSRYGNTRRVAEAIAEALGKYGPVQLAAVENVPTVLPGQLDLVVVGGPTEGHRMTQAVTQLFDRMAEGALEGVAAAAFDTRVRWPLFLSGSAGKGIVKKLELAGAQVLGPAVCFFVGGTPPVLEPGELEQAAVWAGSLAAKLEAKIAISR
jgi:flavodoxin